MEVSSRLFDLGSVKGALADHFLSVRSDSILPAQLQKSRRECRLIAPSFHSFSSRPGPKRAVSLPSKTELEFDV